MADSFDVMTVLAQKLTSIVYPGGTAQPSITGAPARVSLGWPTPAEIDADLLASKDNISVFALPGGQNATRYGNRSHRIGDPSIATLGWTVAGITATLAGTVSVPQNIGIIVDNVAYTYAVLAGDTLASAAAALAALIAVDRTCTSLGAVITIPAARQITARVGTVSNVGRELARQKECYQLTIWTADVARRKILLNAIQAAMADTPRIAMPDGFGARLRYRNGTPEDDVQKSLLYRYDLFYEVEFAITATRTAPQAIAWTVTIYGGSVNPTGSPPFVFNF